MNRDTRDIVLIHGLWMNPRSWELFRAFYENRGYRVLAPAWPRMSTDVEGIRRDPSALNGLGIAEIAAHYETFLGTLDEPPILMGHSFGGLIVELLLNRGFGAAGISIDGVAPQGILRLPWSALKAANAVLSNPLNYGRTVALTLEQFHYGFANTMTARETREAYERYAVPGPGRPVFQQALANFNPWAPNKVDRRKNSRAPLLLIAGSEDHQVPAVLSRINYSKYARSKAITGYKEFPHRSHLIIAQEGWQEVAEYAISWAESETQSIGSKRKIREQIDAL